MKLLDVIYWEPGLPLPAAPEVLDAGKRMCCVQAAEDGPLACICWKPVYDEDQAEPDTAALAGANEKMCADCAYRPRSPERTGDPTFKGDTAELDRIVKAGEPFWCHQGLRRPVKWVHPSGAEIPGHPAAYRPPIRGHIPYKADGSPADLCGGWMLRRMKAMQ